MFVYSSQMVENEQDSVCHSYLNKEKSQRIKNWCQIITEELNENKRIFLFDLLQQPVYKLFRIKAKPKVRFAAGKVEALKPDVLL